MTYQTRTYKPENFCSVLQKTVRSVVPEKGASICTWYQLLSLIIHDWDDVAKLSCSNEQIFQSLTADYCSCVIRFVKDSCSLLNIFTLTD